MSEARDIKDEQLLQLLKHKSTEEKGFRLVVLKYQERLYWQIRKIVPEHADANDVLQNCFVKLYRNIASFEGRSSLYTWLYRVATNEAITYVNKQKRHQANSIDNEELQLANTLHADTYFDGQEAQLLLQRAVAALPAKQRTVFEMRYYGEKSYQEMANELTTSVGALKASYHHAVKKIESYFREVEI